MGLLSFQMKALLCLALVLMSCPGVFGEDLANHVIFKHYLGKWSAEGELKGEDNKILMVKEDWEGKSDGENTFVIEGTRTINEDTQPFKWTFALNPTTGGGEALLTGGEGSQPLRFEVNLSEVNLTLDLKAQTGTNSAITVKESFKDDKHDVLESQVAFTNDEGKTTLEGTITHKKQPKP